MLRVAIYGIGGIYNYGCEAIIRGTVTYIRKMYEDADITYYAKNANDNERKLAKALNINIMNINRKNNFFTKVVSKIIDIIQIPIVPFFRKEYDIVIKNSDVIFSVGGDIYSIPKFLRKKNKYRYVNYMVEFGKRALKKGKKVIIYGASIGPFGNYNKSKKYYSNHLKQVNKIICREQLSVDYLNELGVTKNVELLPDPAFLIEHKERKSERKYIGINLSELSIQEVYGTLTKEVLNDISKIIDNIYSEFKMPIMLIPHVYSPYTVVDNDYLFLKKIFDNLAKETKDNAILIKSDNFIDTKKYLNQCKMVIAARMHCAVNAITIGVPSIFLSYSQKSRGMSRFIYDNEKWCVPVDRIKHGLLLPIKEMLGDIASINDYIEEKNKNIKKTYDDYFRQNNI